MKMLLKIFFLLILIFATTIMILYLYLPQKIKEIAQIKTISYEIGSLSPFLVKQLDIQFEDDNSILPSNLQVSLKNFACSEITYEYPLSLRLIQPQLQLKKAKISVIPSKSNENSDNSKTKPFHLDLDRLHLIIEKGIISYEEESQITTLNYQLEAHDILIDHINLLRGSLHFTASINDLNYKKAFLKDLEGHLMLHASPQDIHLAINDLHFDLDTIPFRDFTFSLRQPFESKNINLFIYSGNIADGSFKDFTCFFDRESYQLYLKFFLEDVVLYRYLKNPMIQPWIGKKPLTCFLEGSYDLPNNKFSISSHLESQELLVLPQKIAALLNLINLSLNLTNNSFKQLFVQSEGSLDNFLLKDLTLVSDSISLCSIGKSSWEGDGTFYCYTKGKILGTVSQSLSNLVKKTPLAKVPFLNQALDLGKKPTTLIEEGVESAIKNLKYLKIETKQWDISNYKITSASQIEKEFTILKESQN